MNNNYKTTGTLAIYARQSREKETNGSIDEQLNKGRKTAEVLGMTYVEYVDKGISAVSDTLTNRPQCMKMMDDIENNIITAVFVYDMSRLTRSQVTNVAFKLMFKQKGIKVYSEMEGIVDFSKSDNEFMADIKALINQKQVRDSSIKIQGVLAYRASTGLAHGGAMKPYGYTGDANKMLIIDEDEASIVRTIFDLSLKGFGSGRIADYLNSQKILTKGQKVLPNGIRIRDKYTGETKHIPANKLKWVGNTVLNMLKNTIYKGERNHAGQTFTVPAIIDVNTWEQVQLQIQKNRNNTGGNKYQYLLKGICFCGKCGAAMIGRKREDNKDNYYFCMSKRWKVSCGNRSLNIDYLEDMVWYAVTNSNIITDIALQEVGKLSDPEHIKDLIAEREILKRQLSSAEAGRSKILDLYKRDMITFEECEADLNSHKESVRAVTEKIDFVTLKLNDENAVRQTIDKVQEFQNQLSTYMTDAPFEVKHEIINRFIERVEVSYNDETEVYSVRLHAKLPELYELPTLHLNNGSVPNLINYDPAKDKYEKKRKAAFKDEFADLQLSHSHRRSAGRRWKQSAAGRNFARTQRCFIFR